MQKETGLNGTEKRVTASQGEWSNTAERYTYVAFGYLLAFVVHLRILFLFGHRSASEEFEQNYPKASSRRSDLGSMVRADV